MSSLAYANPTQPKENDSTWLESSQYQFYMQPLSETQAWLGGYVQSFGEQIDSFFGDDSKAVMRKGNRVVLYTPLIWDEGDLQQNIHIKAELELPKTNHRWKLIFDNWREELSNSPTETVGGDKQSPLSEQSENQVGIRYLLNYSENSFGHIEPGLKFRDVIDPNPYINYLQRYKNSLSENLLSRTTQQLYLERFRGFSWQGQQTFDYQFSNDSSLWRSQSDLTFWHDQGEWIFNQAFLKFDQPSKNVASAYYIDSQWWLHNEHDVLQSVRFGANYRNRLYQDWLYASFEPQIYFTHIDNFDQPNYRIRLQLEIHLYDPR